MTTFTEKKRLQKASWRERNPGLLYSDERPFTGVDGEGGTVPGADHAYFLLRAGEEAVSSESGLDSWTCLDFLSSLPPRPIYVAFFFDYDVTKICEDLGWAKIWRLIHREERMPTRSHWGGGGRPFPVDVHGGEFQIDYLPRKFFKVRKRVHKDVHTPWITINDTGTFFQCPFVDFLDRWDIGTPEQRAAIRKGKEHRNAFDIAELEDIDRYNHLECRLLADGMEKFRATCKRSGYVPRAWQGPGQIAEAVFRARGIPKSKNVPMLKDARNERLLMFAANSFYGGRPEITRIGPVPGPVWQTDINSAYPYAMLSVPCLIHGEWRHETSPARRVLTEDHALVYGHFERKGSSRPRLFGLPMRRRDGSIYYPGSGRGWYWTMEIAAATHQVFTPEEAFTYRRQCECTPFGYIPDLYAMRLRLGKDALGLYLKLVLNSGFGKRCQSIGNPQYANPIDASYITAHTRTRIQHIIHSLPAHQRGECGRDVLMVATDAVFTTAPVPELPTTDLGGLSVDEHPDGIFLIQPGLYFRGDGKKPKTRGVPRTAVAEREKEFLAAWKRMCETGKENDGCVDIPVNVFIGLRQALHRNNLDLAGKWIEYKEDGSPNGKRIGFEWRTKRATLMPPVVGYGAAETFPYEGDVNTETVPYDREIGRWREALRLPFEDQPDWATIIGGDFE